MCVWVSGGRTAAMSLPKPSLAFDFSLHPLPNTRGSGLGAANKKHFAHAVPVRRAWGSHGLS